MTMLREDTMRVLTRGDLSQPQAQADVISRVEKIDGVLRAAFAAAADNVVDGEMRVTFDASRYEEVKEGLFAQPEIWGILNYTPRP